MAQKTDTRTKLLTASPFQLMLSLSIPAIIGMIVVGLYNFMDRVFVGQLINEVAMGAVSVSYPFTLINTGVSTLIGVGSASVLSRAVGKKDQDTIDRIMGNLIALNLIFGIVITILGMIFTRQLLTLSGAEGEILNNAESYLRIIFAGSLFVNFGQSANMIMRGEGILKKAMLITGTGAVLNIILDPIMIIIMKNQGQGVEGAAYATVISQIVTAVITLWYFLKKSKLVRIHKIRVESSLIPEIIGVGFSAMLMQVMTLVQQTTLYNVAAKHGTWLDFLHTDSTGSGNNTLMVYQRCQHCKSGRNRFPYSVQHLYFSGVCTYGDYAYAVFGESVKSKYFSYDAADHSLCSACNLSSESWRSGHRWCIFGSCGDRLDCFGFIHCDACRGVSQYLPAVGTGKVV